MWVLGAVVVIVAAAVLARMLIVDRLTIEKFESKAILVTGCGAGFGNAFVKQCVQRGIMVFAGCRTQQSADKLNDECKDMLGELDAFQMDISSDESVQQARVRVEERLRLHNKELYAVVNNAGIQGNTFVDDMLSLDDYKTSFEVNTFGMIRVTHAFKQLIKQSKGRIICCTSAVVLVQPPLMGPYVAAKAAASAYATVLRHEMRSFGVLVIEVQPGIYRTPLNEVTRTTTMMDHIWERADDEAKAEYGNTWFSEVKSYYARKLSQAPSNIQPAVDTYFHALSARYPYRCYGVGCDTALLYRPFSWFPALIQEWVVHLMQRASKFPERHISETSVEVNEQTPLCTY